MVLVRLEALAIWLGRILVDSKTGEPSAKRFGLLLAVVVLCGVMGLMGGVIGGVTWIARGTGQSVELVRILAGALEVIAGLVLAAVTTGYVAGKAVEREKTHDA